MTETEQLLKRAVGGDKDAEEQLLKQNAGLIRSIVYRFRRGDADTDDLMQLANIGFIKAVRGFDFTYGTQFSTYAVPKIAGEIRRYLRDNGSIKVSRSLREQAIKISAARERLCAVLGREPVLSELAEETGLACSELAEAELSRCEILSLQQESEDGQTMENTLAEVAGEESLIEQLSIKEEIEKLPAKERTAIVLRFYHTLTQEQTARIIGVSQVQVSRLEKRALRRLKERLLPPV